MTPQWSRYSKKMQSAIKHPRFTGKCSNEEAAAKGMRLVSARWMEKEETLFATLFLLVDETDGIVADLKYTLFGPTSMIAALEALCTLAIRKNYDQAGHLSSALLDKEFGPFPPETKAHLEIAIRLIQLAAEECMDIPIEEGYIATPMSLDGIETQGYEGWETLSTAQKLALIEQVIAEEIRPYIELDEGNIRIVDFVDDKELVIAYEGSCTSCYSATGSTLTAIQKILQAKLSATLHVRPDLGNLYGADPQE